MIFRPKLDNGAARGDDEKMQARTKAARALDRALGAAMLCGLSFLWFATRLGALWPAAALAAALTALAAYALHLYRRRRSRRLDAERARAGQRRAAVYRLTMLPEKTALCQAAEALRRAYALTPAGARASVRLFTDAKGRRIAAGLHQSPQPADVREVHDFHRARGEDHGVLICAGGATEAAKSYAGSLEPPLRLLEAERLPLPDPPKCDAPRAAAKKGPAAVLDWNNNYGDDEDKIILFHCGPVAQSLMAGKGTVTEHKMFAKNDPGSGWGCNEGRIKPMPITISNCQTKDGKIVIYASEAKFTDDPIEDGYFGCGGVAEIPHLQDKCITLAKGGFKHHTAICEGHYKDILKEAFTTYLGYDWVDID